MGEDVRKKACKKLGETIRRKGEGEDSSEPKKKRSRKGGNETIQFLREKTNIDMAMKHRKREGRCTSNNQGFMSQHLLINNSNNNRAINL